MIELPRSLLSPKTETTAPAPADNFSTSSPTIVLSENVMETDQDNGGVAQETSMSIDSERDDIAHPSSPSCSDVDLHTVPDTGERQFTPSSVSSC